MSSVAATSTPAEAPTAANERARPSPEPQVIDATKLNALLEDVRGRLTTDIYGNWTINGSKLANDPRHGALGLVFQLVKELEGVKAIMDKQSSTQSGVTGLEAKKAGKCGNSTLSTIRSEIEQQLSTPLNDLKLRCERLEEQSQKAKKENDQLEKKQHDDSQKIKDLSSQLRKAKITLETMAQQNNVVGLSLGPTLQTGGKLSAAAKSSMIARLDKLARAQPSADWTRHDVEKTVAEIRVLAAMSLPKLKLELYFTEVLEEAAAVESCDTQNLGLIKCTGDWYRSIAIWKEGESINMLSDLAKRYESLDAKRLDLEQMRANPSNQREYAVASLNCIDRALELEGRALAVAARVLKAL
ncbi:hypothetical protein LTR85_003002 [Meristemomyces frigidus]|nr:hypothetical protein LTR85_003002 [Meristemomyces frigidus]